LIGGLLESQDVFATVAAMRDFGSDVKALQDGQWRIRGVGVGGFCEPRRIVDFANSGTGVRLAMGAMATTPIQTIFSGDDSLSKRPMQRVLDPLIQMGARVQARNNDFLPITVTGAKRAVPIIYQTPVASAQVKSAILLAGLNAPGQTSVVEKRATRDHTERMLRLFGATVDEETSSDGAHIVRVEGHAELKPCRLEIPGDPSSAGFITVAALLVPDSEIIITDVLVNPLRIGLYETLSEMGADIEFINQRNVSGEPVADLKVRYSDLNGVDVPAARAPSMIDEYPILSIAAAAAEGRTTMTGLAELRVKESNRLRAIAEGLKRCGVVVRAGDDDLEIEGVGAVTDLRRNALPIPGGVQITTHGDHRIAMSFLTLGLISEAPIEIDQALMIGTSFPTYRKLMQSLGAAIEDVI
jgi:3-phosphoshikimate 1-carboxyvinyltransferase